MTTAMIRPRIEVFSFCQLANSNLTDMLRCYDVDRPGCPLNMPDKLTIGSRTWDDQLIEYYYQQVDEYDVWLEDAIKAQNMKVMTALDNVYNMSVTDGGVILVTLSQPVPFHTHAHVVRDTILRLAGNI